ncbi:ABC transporter permease [Georgenia sp. 311]|uniref:ABC transporter permease n=1 Tax=Georgenia wutianyii TaxID=2585135 RepID=A0ABX5VLD5_9MICO|nr:MULTISPECIES: ABC transporter permease [Georgenia]QDB79294.1 ABC transporter permease [Georgenia wutianyii]TNC20963.1 ABC transporter permease [Georgenia sp. 311]
MSTTTTTVPARPRQARGSGVPFTRLLLVELRKQVDTRAGAWLLAVIVLLNAALIALVLFTGEPQSRTWQELTTASSLGQLILLPLIGIMAATGEWSQRTALTTFTLEPRRSRVNLAKLVSAWGLGLVVMAAALAVGAVSNVVGAVLLDGDGAWTMEWSVLGGMLLALVLLVSQGVGFGLALLSTPVAIVAYLALPTAWTVLTALVSGLREPAQWLNLDSAMGPLMEGTMTATGWAQLATSAAVWVGVPLALGLWRTARRDVS